MTTERTDPDASDRTSTAVVAAGGVVLDRDPGASRVLVVHRPAYDDWTLPKGHVDPGETPVAAAVREVLEETGVRPMVIREAGTTEHPVTLTQEGATFTTSKRVHWFAMRPADVTDDPADRAADHEIDRAAWWTVGRALDGLTYASERELLGRVTGLRPPTGGR